MKRNDPEVMKRMPHPMSVWEKGKTEEQVKAKFNSLYDKIKERLDKAKNRE